MAVPEIFINSIGSSTYPRYRVSVEFYRFYRSQVRHVVLTCVETDEELIIAYKVWHDPAAGPELVRRAK